MNKLSTAGKGLGLNMNAAHWLALCGLVLTAGACGTQEETSQVVPNEAVESVGTSAQEVLVGDIVLLKCDNGQKCYQSNKCLYAEPGLPNQGNPSVRLYSCNGFTNDLRFQWIALSSPTAGYVRLQNRQTSGCLEARSDRVLITRSCEYSNGSQAWKNQPMSWSGGDFLVAAASQEVAIAFNTDVVDGNWMHTWPANPAYNGESMAQDWGMFKVGSSSSSCVMFKGLDMNQAYHGYQQCGRYGDWAPSTYTGYQQPRVDGTLPMNGIWGSTNNLPVNYTTSAAGRNSFFADVPAGRLFGTCNGCVN
ncbi:RICIN domain-containing protein [Archangium sp.]|uniref:RICIN domain-containing protein n=1 Tax=Archangium sp. TaxID=1872627 RepID=UPI00286B15D0|nr:RICIN domain-containing protein [Archangium sp.]